MTRLVKQATALLLAGLLVWGCGAKEEQEELSGTITVSSSHAAVPLLVKAKEQFGQKHPQVRINLTDEGSVKGLERVVMGAADIGVSEIQATSEQDPVLNEHRIAITPYVIIVHKELQLNNLSLDQLSAIFKGEVSNWSEVGGPDVPITVVVTPKETGSHTTILRTVLEGDGEVTPQAMVLDTPEQVQDRVGTTPGALGYVDAPRFLPDKAKAIKVDQIPYTSDNFTGGTWPIFAYEHLYTKGPPEGVTRAFLEFLLSAEFQQGPVAELKYIPIKGLDR